jgi:hypothetical protein
MAASRSARGRKAQKGNERQSELPLKRVADPALGPCPRCGKITGELVNAGAGRFPFFVTCIACSFMTERVRTAGIAAKLWNEAKPAYNKKARARRA